jgi:tRNA(Ile)-lysidine synthase
LPTGDSKQAHVSGKLEQIAAISMLRWSLMMAVKTDKDWNRVRPKGLSKFARSLLQEWKRLQLPLIRTKALVAVSGGADSTALLLALEELVKAGKLKIQISVAHVDHMLRKESAADARWVRELAKRLGFDVSVTRVDVKRLAKKNRDNLEQSARRVRYERFAAIAQKHRAGVVLTAHTMDDQAETVLMNLLRGSGSDGLGGIQPLRSLNERNQTVLARPMLSWARRRDTEAYCELRGFQYRRDEMNADESFARVRTRLRLLPVMESFNPRVVEALARTAELLREDSRALESAAERLLELSTLNGSKKQTLSTDLLTAARPALRRRALRRWLAGQRGDLRRLEMAHIRAVEGLLVGNRGGRVVELPGGSTVSRSRQVLLFAPKIRTSVSKKT